MMSCGGRRRKKERDLGADPQGWVTDFVVPTALAHRARTDPKVGDGCYLPSPSLVPHGPTATGVAAASESGEQH